MTDTATLLIDSRCELGEGPFWHPLLHRLFWFDILNQTLFSATADGQIVDRLTFDCLASAAAVIDADTLAIATERGLLRYSLSTDSSSLITEIEPGKPGNRSNDCRVDRHGGFWLSTMSKQGDAGGAVGSLYRYRAGELVPLRQNIAIPNSLCFSPDGSTAYLADTPTKKILKVALDQQTGLPTGNWELFADVEGQRGYPDGAITDAEGYLWSARWGGNCVVRHRPDGTVDRIVEVGSANVSCPAFGGPDYRTLFLTTAREHMSPEELAADPYAGGIYAIDVDVTGLPEPQLVV